MFATVEEGLEQVFDVLSSIKDGFITIVDYIVELSKFLYFTLKTAISFIVHIPQYCTWIPAEAISICIILFVLVIALNVVKGAGSH